MLLQSQSWCPNSRQGGKATRTTDGLADNGVQFFCFL
jgi:hypothetical protein